MAFAPRPAAAFSPRRSGQAAPLLANARVLWLRPAAGDPVMLLEDRDTGDVLMPLVYMKSVFAANYSRKLSSLKHRLVLCKQPAASEAGVPAAGRISSKDFLYWTWAFEAPHEVKVLARQALGDEQAPQGHLRLILLPIVYSAMAQKKALRDMPFFHALHHAMRASAYYRLVELLPTSVQAEVDLADRAQAEEQSLLLGTALSLGPLRTCRQGAETPAAPLATNCYEQRCFIMEEQETEKGAVDVDEELKIKRYRGIVSLHRETSDAELPWHIRIPYLELHKQSLKLDLQSPVEGTACLGSVAYPLSLLQQEVDVDERLQAMQRRMQQLVNGALSEFRLLFRYARHSSNAHNRHN
eukprot:SM000084S23131  [mRNA]  locus=s84:292525:294868:+ [translate_table: standard]